MSMQKSWLFIPFATILLSGCINGTYFQDNISYQRIRAENSISHYPGSGGVVISSSRSSSDRIKSICVAPPASAAQTEAIKTLTNLSAAAAANSTALSKTQIGDPSANISITRNFEVTESITKLFEQNERTLLLQYSLFRLCEAHMNGMFDAYTSPLSELFKIKLTLANDPFKNADLLKTIDQQIAEIISIVQKIEQKIMRLNVLREKIDSCKESTCEQSKNEKLEEFNTIQKEIDILKSVFYVNTYQQAFDKILDTAVKLATETKNNSIKDDSNIANELQKELEAQKELTEQAVKSAKNLQEELKTLREKIIENSLQCKNCKSH